MKTKPLTLLLSLIFFLSFPLPIFADAERIPTEGKELITGAFGFKFGEPVDDSNIIKVQDLDFDQYLVEPIKPHSLFDEYQIWVDLKTKGLISIGATQSCDFSLKKSTERCSMPQCYKDAKFLEKLLVNKYSGLISKGSSVPGLPKNSAEAYSFEIWNKSRRIRVYCKNRHAYDKAFPLQIYYSDDDLDNAQNKRREVEEFLERKEELGDDGL